MADIFDRMHTKPQCYHRNSILYGLYEVAFTVVYYVIGSLSSNFENEWSSTREDLAGVQDDALKSAQIVNFPRGGV